jgi:hypothetical protein
LVEGGLDGLGSVFLEHILVSDVGVILEVNSEVLGLDLLLSVDLLDLEDFSVGLFDLVLGSHDLPELGFGESSVWGNDLDNGDGWLLLSLGGLDSSVDQELSSSSAGSVV